MNEYTALWNSFAQTYALSQKQLDCCQQYAQMLIEWNSRMNLTAITQIPAIINDHLVDSLAGSVLFEQYGCSKLADVGAGAGFPALPLLIKYEQATGILIEINGKKREFLTAVINQLGLANRVTVCELDWLTFLRSTAYDVDLFVARASLRPDELIRALTSKNYAKTLIAYWASGHWLPGAKELPYLKQEIGYVCGDKHRRIALFSSDQSD